MINSSNNPIVIVSGLPRSGTSMMMQMLKAGGLPALTDQVRTADTSNPRGYYEFEPVKRLKADASWLDSAAADRAVKIIHLLLSDLPADRHYRVIFMKRRLDEILASQSAMLKHKGKKGAALTQKQLTALFQQQLDKIQRWLAEQPNFHALYVEHRTVINDPTGSALEVSNFLARKLDIDAMATVVDRSLYRQQSTHSPNGS